MQFLKNVEDCNYLACAVIFFFLIVVLTLAINKIIDGWRKTKIISSAELQKYYKEDVYPDDTVQLVAVKTLYAERQSVNKSGTFSIGFLKEATRQLCERYIDNRYISPISHFSDILPPTGFIGTIIGMIIIFYAGDTPDRKLTTAGLATALITTLIALFFYVVIEILKMVIIKRAKDSIDIGLSKNFEK